MAQKRTFTMKIIDTDSFLEMPLSAQCLYFHLNMRADDDGFIGNPKKIMRTISCHDDDLKLLILKRFILTFDNGVIVIKHWRMHNCINQNRYHETPYTDEKKQLLIKSNKSYSLNEGIPMAAEKIVDMEETTEAIEPQAVNKIPMKNKRNNYPSTFEDLWSAYPRKADKGQAYKQYQARINSGYSPEELLKAVKNYKMECEKLHVEQKYIKYAKTFLGDATPFVDYLKKDELEVAECGKADFSEYL